MTEERNRPAWQAETTHPELAEKLKTALSDVYDPELGLNIIQLGLIRDVVIEDDHTLVTMILTTPFCPYGPALIESTRQKTQEALERDTSIAFGNEMWDFSMMEESLGADWGLY
jgi:metal-sulfur cluster biosynthetic enzyme